MGPACLIEDEVGPVDKKSGASIADVTLVERERRGSSQVFGFLVVRVLSGDARPTTKWCGRKHLPVGGRLCGEWGSAVAKPSAVRLYGDALESVCRKSREK